VFQNASLPLLADRDLVLAFNLHCPATDAAGLE